MTTFIHQKQKPLTASGLGRFFDCAVDPQDIRETVQEHGVAIVKGLEFTEAEFRKFVEGLGKKISYEEDSANVGYGFEDILHLNGSYETEKVITGRGGLPLHTDGVLLGTQVDFIILFAAEVENLTNNGATLVCDQISAWNEMPFELRDVLSRGKLEYRATERGYFTNVPDDWYEISTFRDYGRVKSLNIALPFSSDEPDSWDVRVPGMSSEMSTRFFSNLQDYLMQKRYVYEHCWSTGDLIVIDNQKTLHGRRSLNSKGVRVLFRGQVTLPKIAQASDVLSVLKQV